MKTNRLISPMLFRQIRAKKLFLHLPALFVSGHLRKSIVEISKEHICLTGRGTYFIMNQAQFIYPGASDTLEGVCKKHYIQDKTRLKLTSKEFIAYTKLVCLN